MIIGAVLLVAAAIALLLILLPGIIINGLRGRYKDSSRNFLWASILDWQTWAISLPIAAAVALVLNACGVFDNIRRDSRSRVSEVQPLTSSTTSEETRTEAPRAIVVATAPPSSTPLWSPTTTGSPSATYIVVNVASGDYLNVRSTPAMNSSAIFKLANGDEVQVRGDSVYNGDTEWIPITVGSRQGWVRKRYLKPR